MNRSTTGRLRELQLLFARLRHQWRDFFYELENGEASLLAEDPWADLDDFLASVDPEHLPTFRSTLEEMVTSGDAVEQAQALSIVAACRDPFDLAVAMKVEPALRKDLEAHLAFILAVGQRGFAPAKAIVEKAVGDPSRRHAALIALAQLDPLAAAKHGLEAYRKDRERIVLTLSRPLDEHEYATFCQMAEAVLQTHGKEKLDEFLRQVAGDDAKVVAEFAQLARRLAQQSEKAAV
jgi:hypothetical protein